MNRVMVIDSSPDIRQRVVEAVSEIETAQVIGAYGSAAFAIQGLKQSRPDIVILDDRLQQNGGLEVLRFLKAKYPDVKVIVFSGCAEPYQRDTFLGAGAHAFFAKAAGCEAILDMIRGLPGSEAP